MFDFMIKRVIKKMLHLIFVTMIVVIFFVFFRSNLMIFFNDYLISVYKPFQILTSKGVECVQDLVAYTKKVSYLQEQIEILKRENKALGYNVKRLKSLENRNQELLNILNLSKQNENDSVVAKVIANDCMNYMIIDKGIAHGIMFDMTVITSSGLIGKIESVGQNNSTIMLITNSKSNISSRITSTRELVLAKGMQSKTMVIEYIPIESEIKVGDLVEVSETSMLKEKIVIGEITKVYQNKQCTAKEAVLKPAVDFLKVEEVIVLK